MTILVFLDRQEYASPISVAGRVYRDERGVWRFNHEIAQWITDNLGYSRPDYLLVWNANTWSWYFKAQTSDKALLFKLTWGGR